MGAGKLARRAVKSVAAGVFHYTGARRVLASYRRYRSGGRRINIVSYHRVVADFTGEVQRSIPGLLISQETFRRHLLDADAAGYQFATLDEALDVMAGRKTAKKDLFVVTFDDGYRDVYRYAYPVLKAMGVPAIVYLPTGFIGTQKRFNHDRLFHLISLAKQRQFKPVYEALHPSAASLLAPVLSGHKPLSHALDEYIGEWPGRVMTEVIDGLEQQLGGGPELTPEQGDCMNWDEVRKMAADGIDFGAHTIGHTVLTLEDRVGIAREIRESKVRVEAELGRACEHFAYCNGWYSDEVIDTLVKLGFRSAVTTEDYPNQIGGDPFTLKRKVLWENFSIGMTGDYSSCLTSCQLDDVFGILGMNHPVPGKRPQRPLVVSGNARRTNEVQVSAAGALGDGTSAGAP